MRSRSSAPARPRTGACHRTWPQPRAGTTEPQPAVLPGAPRRVLQDAGSADIHRWQGKRAPHGPVSLKNERRDRGFLIPGLPTILTLLLCTVPPTLSDYGTLLWVHAAGWLLLFRELLAGLTASLCGAVQAASLGPVNSSVGSKLATAGVWAPPREGTCGPVMSLMKLQRVLCVTTPTEHKPKSVMTDWTLASILRSPSQFGI